MKTFFAWASGLVFGTGIAISGMMNPAKVMNFFDVAGTWDPSLAMVMVGAIAVTFIGYRFVLRRPAPLFADGFALPKTSEIDAKLIVGAALFGTGWGVAGFCPGAVLPALGMGRAEVFLFAGAMLAGVALARVLKGGISFTRTAES